MKNWTIRKQISALSGISVGFLLLVAAASLGAVVLLNLSFKDFKGATQRTERLNLILEDLLEANAAAVAFEHTTDPGYAATFRNEVSEIIDLSSIEDRVTGANSAFAVLMSEVNQQAAQYVLQFAAFEGVQDDKSRLVEELSQAGASVTAALNEIGARAGIDGQLAGLKQVTNAMQAFSLSRFYWSGMSERARTPI